MLIKRLPFPKSKHKDQSAPDSLRSQVFEQCCKSTALLATISTVEEQKCLMCNSVIVDVDVREQV
jgi:hypothetical protein